MRHTETTGVMENETFKRLENEIRHLMRNRLANPLDPKSGFPDFLSHPVGHAVDLQ